MGGVYVIRMVIDDLLYTNLRVILVVIFSIMNDD